MSAVYLENEKLRVEIRCKGAEIRSIYGKEEKTEYFWNADPKFWNRSSPILFPFIGNLKDKKYRHEGSEYPMGQHGFVRDMEFEVIRQTDTEVWFQVTDTEETMKVYPFRFVLKAGYQLEENELKVMWKVENPNAYAMHFAIGAHPAFACPLREGEKQSDYFLRFWDKKGNVMESFVNKLLADGGLTSFRTEIRETPDGMLRITEDLFDIDTLVIEENQMGRMALLDGNRQEHVAVEFDSPIVCVWSPSGKCAPFVCIEPWYGRCDCEGYAGELKDREYENTISAGEVFEAEYKIIIK